MLIRSVVAALFLACVAAEARSQVAIRQTPVELSSGEFRDWVYYHNTGWRALQANKLDRAEYAFGRAIEVAKREIAADPRLAARSYADLAWTLHLQGRDSEAEPLARWALGVRQTKFGEGAIQVAQTLYTLASIEIALNKLEEAQGLLARVVSACEKESGPTSPAVADALGDLATVHILRRQFTAARPLLARAEQTIYQAVAPNSPGQVTTLDGLATIDLAEGKTADAEPRLARAVELLARNPSASPHTYARVLTHQARLFRQTARPDEASRAESQARALSDRPDPLPDPSSNAPHNTMPAAPNRVMNQR